MNRSVEHPEWGPGFREYTMTFEHRLHTAFKRYVGEEEIIIDASRDLIPLPLLETTLAVGENMHVVGFQTGDRIFPTLINTIKKYTAIFSGCIFERYYGFLCIRHLVRMVCIGILTKGGIFEGVLDRLNSNLPWVHLLGVLSDATLLYMWGYLEKYDQNMVFLNGPLFLDDTALDLDDAKFLLVLLWNDRASIIPLRAQDALPGLPALILVLSQFIGHNPSLEIKINPDWLRIQDISLRCYFGCLEVFEDTTEERYVIEQINGFTLNLFSKHKVHIMDTYQVWFAVDDDDARRVVEMYSNLPEPYYPRTPLLLSHVVLLWVFGLLRNPNTRRPALDELAASVFKTALALLQLEIDEDLKDLMSEYTRALMIVSTYETIEQIVAFGSSKPKPEVRDNFLKTLIEYTSDAVEVKSNDSDQP
ncbi:unnamed protein product [Rhizoctonia solani]|uniref:Uncharacterized protein n=1 Tax=Rhizoctonia solani TaxID=456999 RepID=A0A8H3ATA5_9AGAM|nr:unnamed protein product [Rhizoctonia solani]